MTYTQIQKHIKEVYGGNAAEFLRGIVNTMDYRDEHLNAPINGITLRKLLSDLIKH